MDLGVVRCLKNRRKQSNSVTMTVDKAHCHIVVNLKTQKNLQAPKMSPNSITASLDPCTANNIVGELYMIMAGNGHRTPCV